MKDLKDIFWYGMADSVLQDIRRSMLEDLTFLQDVKNGRSVAIIHLQKKHLPSVVRNTVNEMLTNKYSVTSMKYRFFGMDVEVTRTQQK